MEGEWDGGKGGHEGMSRGSEGGRDIGNRLGRVSPLEKIGKGRNTL